MVAFKIHFWILLALAAGMPSTLWSALECDLSQYRGQDGLTAYKQGDTLTVLWTGDHGSHLRMLLAIDSGVPTIHELAVRSGSNPWSVLGRNLTAEVSTTSGRRRAGHGLPEKQRWDVYWDAPLSIPGVQTPYGHNPDMPRKPEEIHRDTATYHASACEVRTDGSRLEVSFPGLDMGIFSGRLQLTVYRGTNLMRLEAIAKTEEPSIAYIYREGLKGFTMKEMDRVRWHDTGGDSQEYEFGGAPNQHEVPVVVKNRLLVAEGKAGSIATFPPPHHFFFPRQVEVNLGYVWYRKDNDSSFAFGVRQSETVGNYNYPIQNAGNSNASWSQVVWPLYNAPPGTWQRMAVYFYISPQRAENCRESVMALTHGDHYKPLPGYKTMIGHLHTATTADLTAAGNLDMQPYWLAPVRALGINIFQNAEFHGDGHQHDPGPIRLKELEDYYYVARRNSDRDFLLLPGEQLSSDTYLGGAYEVLFNKPVYWTMKREPGRQFIEQDPKYGTVYRVSNPEEMWGMIKREGALMIYSDPRTKLAAEWWVNGEAPDYPDALRDTEWFRSDRYLGAGYNNIPTDLSEKRICEKRCFDALDDMNNWGNPKYLVAEPDTYKKFVGYELYGEFAVDYVQLDRTPSVEDWTPLVRALAAGRFFVTTGEVLIKNFHVEGTEAVTAEVEWTFPLEFVEVVWGDGKTTGRKVISATDKPPFGNAAFRIPVDLRGKKWVRFATWDSAVNGAFTQPVHLVRR
jgi:hypothetical protein